jgi:hypothetical protein
MTAAILDRANDVGRDFTRPMTVQKNVYFDAYPAAFGESVRQLIGYRTIFVEILSECDCGFRALDVAQHSRKRFIAIK